MGSQGKRTVNSKVKIEHSSSKKLETFALKEHCGWEGEKPKNRSHTEIYAVSLEIMIDGER